MSAGHQIKKARQAATLINWMVGKKRKVNGVVYATRKEARMARATMKKLLNMETNNGRKEEDRTAA